MKAGGGRSVRRPTSSTRVGTPPKRSWTPPGVTTSSDIAPWVLSVTSTWTRCGTDAGASCRSRPRHLKSAPAEHPRLAAKEEAGSPLSSQASTIRRHSAAERRFLCFCIRSSYSPEPGCSRTSLLERVHFCQPMARTPPRRLEVAARHRERVGARAGLRPPRGARPSCARSERRHGDGQEGQGIEGPRVKGARTWRDGTRGRRPRSRGRRGCGWRRGSTRRRSSSRHPDSPGTSPCPAPPGWTPRTPR
jgi:hypothetical protein